MTRRVGVSVAAAMFAALAITPARAETARDWEWVVAPYFWTIGVSLDATVHDDPVVAADATFSDLVDHLDLALAAHFEGRCEHAGFLVDANFMDLGDERTGTARPPLPPDTTTDADLKLGIYEAGGYYRVPGKARGLDLLGGVRLVDLRSRLDVTIPAPFNTSMARGTDANLVDGFAGLRYSIPIGKRWSFTGRGDVATGGTDLTWNALANFGVRLGKTDRYHIAFGWHHMDLDFSSDTRDGIEVETDLALTGPNIGFAIKI